MAYATLPKPGSEYGPCLPTCSHSDCKQTRTMAATICHICNDPLGYAAPFQQDSKDRLVHLHCNITAKG